MVKQNQIIVFQNEIKSLAKGNGPSSLPSPSYLPNVYAIITTTTGTYLHTHIHKYISTYNASYNIHTYGTYDTYMHACMCHGHTKHGLGGNTDDKATRNLRS